MPGQDRTITVRAEIDTQACPYPASELDEDAGVEGDYFVTVSSDLSDADAASTALDQFHADVPVDTLDYFTFTVLDEQGHELTEAPNHEPYSAVDQASVC